MPPSAPSARFDPRTYRDPVPAPWLIRALGPVNRHLVLPHWLRIRQIDFPAAELARLRAAVNRDTAAFLGPNHPEFMTDWMIDKEISRLVSPLMAHWASSEIVNASPAAQKFWLANNLIANAPGGRGKEYTVRWASFGHGVLLHPEGTASWHRDHIGRVLPGIVEMAWDTCTHLRAAGSQRSVFVVPIVWKLSFLGDATAGLLREMGYIERQTGVAPGAGLELIPRFLALQVKLLQRQCARFEVPAPARDASVANSSANTSATGEVYFAAQTQVASVLRSRLEERYGKTDGDFRRFEHTTRRAIRERAAADPDRAKHDRLMLNELQRLHGFTAEYYDVARMKQEHVAENLKRTRASLVTRGFGNVLHNTVPVAVAPRIARIRVPEPIAVHEVWTADATETESRRAALLEELGRRMRAALPD